MEASKQLKTYINTISKKKENTHIDIINKLFQMSIQAHIWHLQTLSFAEHKALDGLYKELVDIRDGFIETLQGKLKTIFKGYSSSVYKDYIDNTTLIADLTSFKDIIESYRTTLPTSFANIDNQLQTLIDLLEGVIYKLKFLK